MVDILIRNTDIRTFLDNRRIEMGLINPREIAKGIDYIARLNRVWIEGQVVQISRRSGSQVYLTVRDVDVDASVSVVISGGLDRSMNPASGRVVRMLWHRQ